MLRFHHQNTFREKRGITHRRDTFERYRENINGSRARLGEMVEHELRALNLAAGLVRSHSGAAVFAPTCKCAEPRSAKRAVANWHP